MPWRSYAQLVRLPNLPSALADIGLAGLATGLIVARPAVFLLLLTSSACLYLAGMVWNDYFDIDQDRRERPTRPLPSGAVAPRRAALLGGGLMAVGLALAVAAGFALRALNEGASILLPAIVAGLLTLMIFAYDAWLKHTPVGPIAMGSCRSLNILLGFTLAGSLRVGWPLGPHLAAAVGIYIVGVTWLARTEARVTSKSSLIGAALVVLAAFALALAVPAYRRADTASVVFPYLLVGLGFFIGFPLWRAIANPTPATVQGAVRRCLMGLILFDTALATGAAGSIGLVLLVLMGPSVYLNTRRWLYAT
jgi:1,4-dihydroxy-2-naphthoate octaprenyltransferase